MFINPPHLLGFARGTARYRKYEPQLHAFINSIQQFKREATDQEMDQFLMDLDWWVLEVPDFFAKLQEDDNFRGLLLDAIYLQALHNQSLLTGEYFLPIQCPLRYLVECYRLNASEREIRHRFPDPVALLPGYGFFALSRFDARKRTNFVKMVANLLPPASLDFQTYCNVTFRHFPRSAPRTVYLNAKNVFSGFALEDMNYVGIINEDPDEFALLLREVLQFFLEATLRNKYQGKTNLDAWCLFRYTPVTFQGREFPSLLEAFRKLVTSRREDWSFFTQALSWVFESLEGGGVSGPAAEEEEEDMPAKKRCRTSVC